METRCLTVVKELGLDSRDLIVMYRQMDGYVSGHGAELIEFLQGREIIDGIPVGTNLNRKANGMGCLAAQLVAHFKTDIGGFYMHPSGERECGEEYIYTVFTGPDGVGPLQLQIESGYGKEMKTIYQGAVADFAIEKVAADEE